MPENCLSEQSSTLQVKYYYLYNYFLYEYEITWDKTNMSYVSNIQIVSFYKLFLVSPDEY